MNIRWLAVTTCTVGIAAFVLLDTQFSVSMAPTSHNVSVNTQGATQAGNLMPSRADISQPGSSPDALLEAKKLRFRLVGVVASGDPNSGSQGVALVSIDGKPAQAYRVGDAIDSGHIIQAIQVQSVSIGPSGGPPLFSLELQTSAPGAAQSLQTLQARQIFINHPPAQQLGDTLGSAPNVLLNNPADMAPANERGYSVTPGR